MIALIDYKAGNLTSVKKALAALGADVVVPSTPGELAGARGIIVPGVGHFGATRAIDRAWIAAILERIGEGRPLFGICLGMQWLFEGSGEAPDCPGLGVFSGRCYRLGAHAAGWSASLSGERFHAADAVALQAIKIPHVGWNSLTFEHDAPILDGVASGAQVYFTHSYVAPLTSETVAVAEHGEPFTAVVQRAHIAGVQFHPEKSGDVGLRILSNFLQQAG